MCANLRVGVILPLARVFSISRWGVLFGRPVFEVGDTVVIRKAAGLNNELVAKIINIEGFAVNPPVFLTFDNIIPAMHGQNRGGKSGRSPPS